MNQLAGSNLLGFNSSPEIPFGLETLRCVPALSRVQLQLQHHWPEQTGRMIEVQGCMKINLIHFIKK